MITEADIEARRALIEEARILLAGAKERNDGNRRPGDVFLGQLLDLFDQSLGDLEDLREVAVAAHDACILQPGVIAKSDADAGRFRRLYDLLQKVVVGGA